MSIIILNVKFKSKELIFFKNLSYLKKFPKYLGVVSFYYYKNKLSLRISRFYKESISLKGSRFGFFHKLYLIENLN